jgi:hypothetical protein
MQAVEKKKLYISGKNTDRNSGKRKGILFGFGEV